jgi:DNA-binding LacI/PurR family transcriptional regulator
MGLEGAANLREIAERLDISTATVSRALRGLKGVHPRTQARILKVADEMGYERKDERPEASRIILVLAQASGSDNVQYYLSGVSRGAIDCNSLVMTHYLPMDRCEEMLDPTRQPSLLRDGQVDGVLLICRWPDAVVAELARKVPLVSLVHQYPGIPMDRVGVDNESGMAGIVEHLAGLGHRKIGFFGMHPRVSWSRSRYAACFEAMLSHGLEMNLDWTVVVDEKDILAEGILDASAYVPQVKALISAGVTALICSGDQLCYGLRDALMKEGVLVPEDLSLTGYHVQPSRSGLTELTSVSLSSEELGEAAVRRLLRRLELPDESSRTILLPCELVVGSSTSAPRQ